MNINETQRKIISDMYRHRKDVQEVFSKCENVRYFPPGEYKDLTVTNALFEHPSRITDVIVSGLCILIGGPKDTLKVDGKKTHFETLIAIDYPVCSFGGDCVIENLEHHSDIKVKIHDQAKVTNKRIV